MNYAYVYKDRTGYWVAEKESNREKIGGYHDSELAAYKAANRSGCLVK